MTEGLIRFVETTDDALDCLRWLGERRDTNVLALDTETGGLDWHRDAVRLVQFGDTESAWVVPWRWFAGLVRDVLQRWDGEWVGHNLSFDVKMLEGPQGFNGRFFPWARAHDTMLALSLVEPDKSKGLKPACGRWVHAAFQQGRDDLEDGMRKNKWTWATVPETFPPYVAYAGLDTIGTACLHPLLQARLLELDSAAAYDLEREARIVCTRMEQRGSPVDLDYCRRKAAELRNFAHDTAVFAQREYGIASLGSNDAVIAKLRADGVQLTKLTASGGKLSLDEEVLTSPLVQQHPLAQAVHGYRKAIKLASTYFESFIDKAVGGRLYPSINTVAARTGRMSIDNPAMQTLPRGPIVRDAIAAEDGDLVIAVDYQGMEARMLASLANEERMIEVCKAFDAGSGPDIHTATAQLVYGLGSEKPTKQQRDIVKNALFAATYGAGPRKFAITAGVDLEQGKQVFERFMATYPGIRNFQARLMHDLKATEVDGYGQVRQPDGRVHRIELDKAYTVTNYLIQGYCASVFKRAIVDCSRAGLDDYLLLPVHDELVASAPAGIASQVRAAIMEQMQDLSFTCPLVVGAGEPARTWGEAK